MDVVIEIVKILIGLTCVLAIGVSIYKIIKEYKRYKTITQKIVFWIMIIAYFFPIVIFYIDYYNIPSQLGWSKSMDVSVWLEVIMTYVVTIIAAVIGAVVTIKSVQLSINLQEQNRLEEKKKDVLPLLKVEREKEYDYRYKYLQFDCLFTEESKARERKNLANTAHATIRIKNIGMRELYDFYICNIESTYFKEKNEIHYMYPIIYKDDGVCINFYFYELGNYDNDLKEDKYHIINSPIKFDCYFKDCYGNWYYQTLETQIIHKIIENVPIDEKGIDISIHNTNVINAPVEISKKDLPWKNNNEICYH